MLRLPRLSLNDCQFIFPSLIYFLSTIFYRLSSPLTADASHRLPLPHKVLTLSHKSGCWTPRGVAKHKPAPQGKFPRPPLCRLPGGSRGPGRKPSFAEGNGLDAGFRRQDDQGDASWKRGAIINPRCPAGRLVGKSQHRVGERRASLHTPSILGCGRAAQCLETHGKGRRA